MKIRHFDSHPKSFVGSAIRYDLNLSNQVVCRAMNDSKFEIKLTRKVNTEIWAKPKSGNRDG